MLGAEIEAKVGGRGLILISLLVRIQPPLPQNLREKSKGFPIFKVDLSSPENFKLRILPWQV